MPAPKQHDELPSYSLDEEEVHGWRRWLRGRKLVLLVALLAVFATALVGAKPLYRELKARRALAIAEQAGAAIDRGEGGEASALLRQAALMAFQDERVAARITYHAARAGDMASVTELGKKLTEGNASPEEILVFGERSLAAGKPDDAARALEALPDDLPAPDAIRRTALFAGLLQARGKAADARDTLRKTVADAPAGEADNLRVMLAGILLGEEGTPSRDEAVALLEQAASGSGEDGASALRLLAASKAAPSAGPQSGLDETIARLRNHPASKPADELLIARFVIASDPSRTDEAVRSMVARLEERGAPLDDRVAAGRWLIGLQAYDAALELVGPEEPSKHAGALMVRLDALSGLGRRDECIKLIEDNHGGTLPDTLYYLFRARIAEAGRDNDAAEAEKRQLRQAMQFAEPPHILFAARYAESVGWKPEAFAAWRMLGADSGIRPDALRGQLRTLPNTMSAADGAEIAGELLALQPADPSVRLSAAYLRLMAGMQIAESAAVVEEMLAADPESADIRRTAALARLRTGNASGGLKIWPGDNGEDRWQALHVALLRTTGQDDAAEKAARRIDTGKLTPEERGLLKERDGKPAS